jgi:hydrogenase maturation protein HypF
MISSSEIGIKNSQESLARIGLKIRGVVQGVGFRPFIFLLARQMGLKGWVCNSSEGATIEAEGASGDLEEFISRIQKEKPPHAVIRGLEAVSLSPQGATQFEIRASASSQKITLVLPDFATCSDCLGEIFDLHDRRYRYPFTNCTHCGPRFSILETLPYDRANTTMRGFAMCDLCRAEYENPEDRRFHAQPNACPRCGPHLALWDPRGDLLAPRHQALLQAAEAIRSGKIVAVKGLGGFHLVADAGNEEAVALLRRRKGRDEKPFALMFPSLSTVRECTMVSELEEGLLISPESPIVLLRRKKSSDKSPLAPGNPYLGIMLPSTPLHHLLMAELGFSVVATSGNRSEEPICTDEREALDRLRGLADFFLVHNRPIARHVDDSIVRVIRGREMILRRARGYVPLPFSLGDNPETILAVGGHLKNTVAFTVGRDALVSQHIGDLETPQAFEAFHEVIDRFQGFYELQPKQVVCDLHPDYTSTHYASRSDLPLTRVQHHHAHVVSCMAEHGMEGRVLGVAWDGTGYGPDGTIWGGEFLLSTRRTFERAGHFLTFPLPGGEKAVREPRRTALGLLYEIFGEGLFEMKEPPLRNVFSNTEWNCFREMLFKKIQSPRTSSVGRLFDGVAALIGLRKKMSFEGQAAMELEFAAEGSDSSEIYPMEDFVRKSVLILDWRPMISEILKDREKKVPTDIVARKFHNTLAECIIQAARRFGEKRVVLTGGCFQNKLLTESAIRRLENEGLQPYWHRRIPPNDGGISLGQAAVAAERIRGLKECV